VAASVLHATAAFRPKLLGWVEPTRHLQQPFHGGRTVVAVSQGTGAVGVALDHVLVDTLLPCRATHLSLSPNKRPKQAWFEKK
jgi:hypothetical protein